MFSFHSHILHVRHTAGGTRNLGEHDPIATSEELSSSIEFCIINSNRHGFLVPLVLPLPDRPCGVEELGICVVGVGMEDKGSLPLLGFGGRTDT